MYDEYKHDDLFDEFRMDQFTQSIERERLELKLNGDGETLSQIDSCYNLIRAYHEQDATNLLDNLIHLARSIYITKMIDEPVFFENEVIPILVKGTEIDDPVDIPSYCFHIITLVLYLMPHLTPTLQTAEFFDFVVSILMQNREETNSGALISAVNFCSLSEENCSYGINLLPIDFIASIVANDNIPIKFCEYALQILQIYTIYPRSDDDTMKLLEISINSMKMTKEQFISPSLWMLYNILNNTNNYDVLLDPVVQNSIVINLYAREASQIIPTLKLLRIMYQYVNYELPADYFNTYPSLLVHNNRSVRKASYEVTLFFIENSYNFMSNLIQNDLIGVIKIGMKNLSMKTQIEMSHLVNICVKISTEIRELLIQKDIMTYLLSLLDINESSIVIEVLESLNIFFSSSEHREELLVNFKKSNGFDLIYDLTESENEQISLEAAQFLEQVIKVSEDEIEIPEIPEPEPEIPVQVYRKPNIRINKNICLNRRKLKDFGESDDSESEEESEEEEKKSKVWRPKLINSDPYYRRKLRKDKSSSDSNNEEEW